jgi:hypothetical protein
MPRFGLAHSTAKSDAESKIGVGVVSTNNVVGIGEQLPVEDARS